MKRRLYVDGNTVYGIDEECMQRKQQTMERQIQGYLMILLCAAYKASIKE
ncbi:MAG: hypothetical protein J6J86_04075 [Lachnospiraceae bacterium]|nr:hypothetical protein [Lachnospiraceae bacterium]